MAIQTKHEKCGCIFLLPLKAKTRELQDTRKEKQRLVAISTGSPSHVILTICKMHRKEKFPFTRFKISKSK